jgi:Holliday junction DNA helicase RuvA
MLGFIEGKIISKNEETHQCVLQMHRLGFEILLPKRHFDTLTVGARATFWIHTHVREDILALYGFATETEKQFFRQLLSVSGLGPKTALAVLGEHGAERLTKLIIAKEVDEISTAPGVGKKIAQRLVLELASKVEKWAWLEKSYTPETKVSAEPASPQKQLRDDLSSALQNLGYVPAHIKTTLDKILDKEGLEAQGFEICLRRALREMSGRALPG